MGSPLYTESKQIPISGTSVFLVNSIICNVDLLKNGLYPDYSECYRNLYQNLSNLKRLQWSWSTPLGTDVYLKSLLILGHGEFCRNLHQLTPFNFVCENFDCRPFLFPLLCHLSSESHHIIGVKIKFQNV